MPDDVSASAPKGNRPVLALAAESIAAVSGVAETVVDVLHGRAFRHYAEGLKQYLAIRLGSTDAAAEALNELRAVVAARDSADLVRPPGIRGRLYRLAREIVDRRRTDAASVNREALPWRPVRPDVPKDYARALGRLRTELSDKEAELLELRYARELPPEEVAHVLDATAGEVEQKLQAAHVQARFMVDERTAADEDLFASAIIEAFALDTRVDTIELEEHEPIAANTVVGGRYEVMSRVGSGAFADVYRANDTEVPGHVVALKLLHQTSLSEEARARALRELHLIASVFHPSVVQFKDHGWYEQRLWFVMPWYEGETLEARINRRPLERPEARRIFQQLAEALATMHAAGIRHQDVKPDNILLARLKSARGDEGVLPVLLDLGVAAKEAEMVVAGTPTYFAPEVAAQFAAGPKQYPITHKADVFALALALRNSLEPSTQDDVPAGAVEHFIEHRAQHRPELPVDESLRFLDPFFDRWLAIDPDDRPTAQELASELAVLTRPEERRERRIKLLRWLVPSLVAIAVSFGAVVYVFGREAELERLEAQQARIEAADAIADLGEESERREALEEDVARIRDNLQESRLSKQQLTDRLAEREGALNQARAAIVRQRRFAASLREDLGEARAEGERLTGELATTRGQLSSERSRSADLSQELSSTRETLAETRTQLEEARGEAERARSQVAELNAQVATLRGQLQSEEARSDVLERRIADAEAARARSESELESARRRIAQLERQLARRDPGGSPTPGGGEEGGGGDTGTEPTAPPGGGPE